MRTRNDSTLALSATTSHDALTGIPRDRAQRMLAQAIDAEVVEWIECNTRDTLTCNELAVIAVTTFTAPSFSTAISSSN